MQKKWEISSTSTDYAAACMNESVLMRLACRKSKTRQVLAALHGERLAGARLAVREDAHVVAVKHRGDQVTDALGAGRRELSSSARQARQAWRAPAVIEVGKAYSTRLRCREGDSGRGSAGGRRIAPQPMAAGCGIETAARMASKSWAWVESSRKISLNCHVLRVPCSSA